MKKIKKRWKEAVDSILMSVGSGVSYTLHLPDSPPFKAGDVLRTDRKGTKIIIADMSDNIVTVRNINKIGKFILWCRDIKDQFKTWKRRTRLK